MEHNRRGFFSRLAGAVAALVVPKPVQSQYTIGCDWASEPSLSTVAYYEIDGTFSCYMYGLPESVDALHVAPTYGGISRNPESVFYLSDKFRLRYRIKNEVIGNHYKKPESKWIRTDGFKCRFNPSRLPA